MEIISKTTQFKIEEATAVALGKFDGIHLGHVKLINSLLIMKKKGYKTVVFTFDTQASSFFLGKNIKEITTLPEKRIIFEKLGIDILVEYPLNKETAAISPEDFIDEVLIDKLNMHYIAAGKDVSFGYRGKGDAELLEQRGREKGYEVDIIDKLSFEGREISSTYVREEISKGNMETVRKLLGHPYSFTGVVSKGFRLGRNIGMPTMNQYPDENKILPPLGVYYSRVFCRDKAYYAITNIGMRPTVSLDDHISVETYLYDFDEDAYGETIVTELLGFKRHEMKFGGVDELKTQMHKDMEDGRIYHGIF